MLIFSWRRYRCNTSIVHPLFRMRGIAPLPPPPPALLQPLPQCGGIRHTTRHLPSLPPLLVTTTIALLGPVPFLSSSWHVHNFWKSALSIQHRLLLLPLLLLQWQLQALFRSRMAAPTVLVPRFFFIHHHHYHHRRSRIVVPNNLLVRNVSACSDNKQKDVNNGVFKK